MFKKCLYILAIVGAAGLIGCRTYDVKAYDLSGKVIWEGTVKEAYSFPFGYHLETDDGKRIGFYNATTVWEEK